MSRKDIQKKEVFSLRKLSIGVVSVVIGSFFFLPNSNDLVHADEIKEPESASVDQATLDKVGELASKTHVLNQISHDNEATVASEAVTPQSASESTVDQESTASADALSQSAPSISESSHANELVYSEETKNSSAEITSAKATDYVDSQGSSDNKQAENKVATQTTSLKLDTASFLATGADNSAALAQLGESKAETNATDFSQYVDNANSMASIATSLANQADLSSATTALSNAASVANSISSFDQQITNSIPTIRPDSSYTLTGFPPDAVQDDMASLADLYNESEDDDGNPITIADYINNSLASAAAAASSASSLATSIASAVAKYDNETNADSKASLAQSLSASLDSAMASVASYAKDTISFVQNAQSQYLSAASTATSLTADIISETATALNSIASVATSNAPLATSVANELSSYSRSYPNGITVSGYPIGTSTSNIKPVETKVDSLSSVADSVASLAVGLSNVASSARETAAQLSYAAIDESAMHSATSAAAQKASDLTAAIEALSQNNTSEAAASLSAAASS
ncbi:YSIRK-type signal peptide-containing protein, partial [Limosilactobacillus fastidiosus]